MQAFTRAVEGRDRHVESFCLDLVEALHAENERQDSVSVWRSWLAERGFPGVAPHRQANRVLRATLPTDAFGSAGEFRLYQLGSFEVRRHAFLQLWCDDDALRTAAVLDRAASVLRRRPNLGDDALAIELASLASLLEVRPPEPDEVRRRAVADRPVSPRGSPDSPVRP